MDPRDFKRSLLESNWFNNLKPRADSPSAATQMVQTMANEVITVPYPFVRCKATVFDGEEERVIDSWRPGCEDWMPDAYHEGRYADGIGAMMLTMVSAHKPGKYPERVFYVRQWTTPDGVTFGKTNLRVTTRQAFNLLCKGYRHPYTLDEPATEGGDGR